MSPFKQSRHKKMNLREIQPPQSHEPDMNAYQRNTATRALLSQGKCHHNCENPRWATKCATHNTLDLQALTPQQTQQIPKTWDVCTLAQCRHKDDAVTRMMGIVRYKRGLYDIETYAGVQPQQSTSARHAVWMHLGAMPSRGRCHDKDEDFHEVQQGIQTKA